MANPKGYKIDVSKSIRLGMERREAPTLGFSYQEDAPSQNEEVQATYYYNVMPTDRGYRSAFNLLPYHYNPRNTTFRYIESRNQAEAVKASPKQAVLWVETGSLERVGLILGEDGIWFIAPGIVQDDENETGLNPRVYARDWALIHSLPFEQNVRYLWTHCTIDGVVYAYRQGGKELYIFTDYAYKMRSSTSEVVWENEYLQCKLIRAVPTFLNMEGQMGIFRADNRLGFWDSDNSIAWSSALDKLDFKPDVTTFAGNTKYSEVSGIITKVLEHGKGFIIYATRSIVHCQALQNSPEKWAGSAIVDNSGVQFDTQIAVGHPSTVHYAWVDNSLAVIENGSIQFSMPELADMVNWQNSLVMLTAPCSRYLYISLGQSWNAGSYLRRAQVLLDPNGEPFWKVPGYTNPGSSIENTDDSFWSELIAGGLTDWTEPNWVERNPEYKPYLPGLSDRKPLIPFYSGHTYKQPINTLPLLEWNPPSGGIPTTHPMGTVESFKWGYLGLSVYRPEKVTKFLVPDTPDYGWEEVDNEVSEYIYSGEFTPYMTRSDWDMTDITQIGTRYIDKAGKEFIELVYQAYKDYQDDVDYIAQKFEDEADRKKSSATLFDYLAVRLEAFGYSYSKGWDFNVPEIDTSCTTVEPIDVTKSQSFMAPDWKAKLESKDPTQLEALADDFSSLAKAIRRAVAQEDVEGLRTIASIHKDLEPEIFAAIRLKDLSRLEAVAKRYDKQSETIQLAVETGDISGIEDTIPAGHDWERVIENAIYNEVDIPGVQIVNLGVVTGVLPLDKQVQTVWDGCKMQMLAKMDRLVAVVVRYLTNETVQVDSAHCRPPGTQPDPDNPTYSWYMKVIDDVHPGGVYLAFQWWFIPESLMGLTYEERDRRINDSESDLWIPIFDAKLSGWGYEDRLGGNARYVKTHNVSPFTPCEISLPKKVWAAPPTGNDGDDYLNLDYPDDTIGEVPYTKPNFWEREKQPGTSVPDLEFYYPSVELGSANFQKGTKHPYYPTYEWAFVYDHLLKKWGSLDYSHQLIFSSYPVNSNSQVQSVDSYTRGTLSAGIIPVFRTPSSWNWDNKRSWTELYEKWYSAFNTDVLATHLTPVGLSSQGDHGEIAYTKIGAQRAGHTKFTGISVKLEGVLSSGDTGIPGVSVELGASLSNLGYVGAPEDKLDYNEYVPYPSQLHRWTTRTLGESFNDLEAPANVVGRWANVILRGNFDLTGLTVYGKPVGRLRYFRQTYRPGT